MAIIPNTVILATAYAISLFLAFIIGPVAIIAVVPQTVLPIAIKYDILLEIFNFLMRSLMAIKTLIIQIIISGIAIVPNFKNSKYVLESITSAVQSALQNKVSGVITSPVCKKMLIKYLDDLKLMGSKRHHPMELKLHEIYQKEYCLSPIPALAMHTTNINTVYGLPPNFNWEKVWNENKIDN